MAENRKPAAVMEITLAADGTVTVSGPLKNKVICLGMLEEAKLAVHSWHQRKADQPQVQTADASLLHKLN